MRAVSASTLVLALLFVTLGVVSEGTAQLRRMQEPSREAVKPESGSPALESAPASPAVPKTPAVEMKKGHSVHREEYGGTEKMDQSLFVKGPPSVKNVTPLGCFMPGASWNPTLNGGGFGSPGEPYLLVIQCPGKSPVHVPHDPPGKNHILSWSPSAITFKVPRHRNIVYGSKATVGLKAARGSWAGNTTTMFICTEEGTMPPQEGGGGLKYAKAGRSLPRPGKQKGRLPVSPRSRTLPTADGRKFGAALSPPTSMSGELPSVPAGALGSAGLVKLPDTILQVKHLGGELSTWGNYEQESHPHVVNFRWMTRLDEEFLWAAIQVSLDPGFADHYWRKEIPASLGAIEAGRYYSFSLDFKEYADELHGILQYSEAYSFFVRVLPMVPNTNTAFPPSGNVEVRITGESPQTTFE